MTSRAPPSKQEALDEILDIAKRHNLSFKDVERAFLKTPDALSARNEKVVIRVLGYLGGLFVFCGVFVFIVLQWEVINGIARIVVTLGTGTAALVFALFAVNDARYEKSATPMFIVAALLEPTGIFVALHEFSIASDWHLVGFSVSAVMLVQQAIAFLHTRRTALLFISVGYFQMLLWTLLDGWRVGAPAIAAVMGASMLCASYGIDRTAHKVITPFWYFVGATAFLAGVFELVRGTALEFANLVVSCLLVYASTFLRSRTLLMVSTLSIFSYVGYFTGKHFVESIGWPIALIMLGAFLVGLSALAVNLSRKSMQG